MKNRPARRYRAGASWKTGRSGLALRACSRPYSGTSAWALKTLIGRTRTGEVIAPFGPSRPSRPCRSCSASSARATRIEDGHRRFLDRHARRARRRDGNGMTPSVAMSCPYCTTSVPPFLREVEQARVVRDEFAMRLICARADDDGAEAAEVDDGKFFRADDRDGNPELPQERRDVVAHALDVRDAERGGDRDIHRLEIQARTSGTCGSGGCASTRWS